MDLKRFEILHRNDLHRFHLSTLDILEKIGIEVPNPEITKKMEYLGAVVDRARNTVRFPHHLVEEAIKKSPRKYTYFGTNPKHDVVLRPDGEAHFMTNGCAMNILDLDTREVRNATKKDLEDATRLADACENFHIVGQLATPSDVPVDIIDVYSWEIVYNNTDKPTGFVVHYSPKTLKYIIKMAEIISGGREELIKRPIVKFAFGSTSPLRYSPHMLEMLLQIVEHRLPLLVAGTLQSGATSPVTLAGTLLQQNVENMAGITIIQLLCPGTPILYGGYSAPMDMKTASLAVGSPEVALLTVGAVQLAHYYGIPAEVGLNFMTNSNLPDIQAGYEKSVTALTAVLSGAQAVQSLGVLGNDSILSFEQVLIDNEICGSMHRIMKGIEVNDGTIAEDVINEVGPGGHFLARKHTSRYFKNEHWIPELGNRYMLNEWKRKGSNSILDNAKKKVKKMLEVHHPEYLDKVTQRELQEVVKEAERTISKG